MNEPETLRPPLTVNPALCLGCGHCGTRCPTGAIRVRDIAEIDGALCIRCFTCAGRCPTGAIS